MADELDQNAFEELMEESQDLQSDAMKQMAEPLDAIVEIGRERRASREYAELMRERTVSRRAVAGAGLALGATGLIGGLGMRSAAAQTPSGGASDDVVMALQTAASLENLAVFAYETALTLPYLKTDARAIKTVAAFAKMTMAQHTEHGKAFNAKAKELGGKEQTETNPKYTPIVMDMVPKLKAGGPLDVIALAITLEDVATSTYVKNIQELSDPMVRLLFGTVAGVESQHLATLYSVQALLKGGLPELVTVKESGGATDVSKLPAAAGSVGVPEVFKKTMLASPPAEGAVA